MDYSKGAGGGTRILDQGVARTLATGHGSTATAARATGSSRAQRTVEGIKPGAQVSDGLLKQMHGKRQNALDCATMDPPPEGPESVENAWPVKTGSKSHGEANAALEQPAAMDDQGEQKRVPSTGQNSRVIQQGPLSRAGR